MMSNRKFRGFTLVELLVVIAVIALLMSILIPSLGRARELAKKAPCMSNEKNMGAAVALYATNNSEIIPPYRALITSPGLTWHWPDLIQPYFDADAVRATTPMGDAPLSSIGGQPRSGNYNQGMPNIRYSKRSNCPSIPNTDAFEYSWNVAYYATLFGWIGDFVDPAPRDPHSWPWSVGATNNVIRMAKFKHPADFCCIIETDVLWGDGFYNLVGGDVGDWYQLTAIANAAPHLGSVHGVTFDGHVATYDNTFLTQTFSGGYPFDGQ